MNHIDYLRKIGAKGGEKRAHNPDRRELAIKAALASWTPEARAKRLSSKRAKHQLNGKIAENKV